MVLNSLQRRLLAWLVVPLAFLSLAYVASTYSDTRKTAETIFDKLLVTLAISISEHALASEGDLLADDVLELIRETTNDALFYKVIGPDASFITGYEDIPEPPGGIDVLNRHMQFYDATYLDQDVRVVAISSLIDRPDSTGWTTTFVAQTLNDREEFVSSVLLESTMRIVAMILVATILMSIGISLGLRPLRALEASVNRRDEHDLSPIRQQDLPREVDSVATALNELLHRLSSTITLTKRLVENAAHQLRTPVTALLPQIDLALRHAESERERKAVGRIKRSAEKITRLTNQLLSLTYAESMSLAEKDFIACDLAQIAEEHVATLVDQNPEIDITAEFESAPTKGKPLLIGEIVDNLVDNAHKYSRENGDIVVRTFIDGDAAVLEVSDSGPGLSDDYREKVFERFYRAGNGAPGSGLGLSIVKEIVESHRGQVSIKDGVGGAGVTVRCEFAAQTT